MCLRHSERSEESASIIFSTCIKRCWNKFSMTFTFLLPWTILDLLHKKSLLTTLRYRSSDFLFLRVCAIASHYTKSAYFRVWLTKKFRKKILRLKPQYDDRYFTSFWTHEVGEESILFKTNLILASHLQVVHSVLLFAKLSFTFAVLLRTGFALLTRRPTQNLSWISFTKNSRSFSF